MSGVRLRATPPLPGLSAFPELNVRTYVRHGGHAGAVVDSELLEWWESENRLPPDKKARIDEALGIR